MIRRCALLVLFALVSLASAQGQEKTAARIQKRLYDFKEADMKMEYALFVHSKYDKAKKTPLVVALHGLGGNPQKMMRYRGLTDLAEKYGYIVVAPMGYNERAGYGAWGKKGLGGKDPNAGELSEKDVMNVLAIVRKEFNIDGNRIYLMGHSMGGAGTVFLGVKYADTWAALAPIAPALFAQKPASLEKIKHMPIIMVQGDADAIVRVGTVRPWAEQMKKLEMTYEYIEVAGGDHINIAFTKMPNIFEFFEMHKKKPQSK